MNITPRLLRMSLLVLALALTPWARNAHAAPLEVVTSFSILADFVRQVGGERVRVTPLVQAGEDAHGFEPRPSDARRVRAAQLVVVSGLGFDPWMERLARTAGYTGRLLIASSGVTPLSPPDTTAHAHGHGHADSEPHEAIDPHAWQDVAKARRYVENIAQALAEADPAGSAQYRANTARYLAELATLDADIRTALQRIPAAQRKVVSGHDAFGYFAHAYGVRFLAPAGISNHSEASAAGVARLIRQLRAEGIAAVFLENISDARLIERIRKESGARIGGTLYSDALSPPDGPAPSYVAMMRHNLATLVTALAGDAARTR